MTAEAWADPRPATRTAIAASVTAYSGSSLRADGPRYGQAVNSGSREAKFEDFP